MPIRATDTLIVNAVCLKLHLLNDLVEQNHNKVFKTSPYFIKHFFIETCRWGQVVLVKMFV